MSEKRRGLGKGLGALIPTAPVEGRPVDVFFPDQRTPTHGGRNGTDGATTSAPGEAPTTTAPGPRGYSASRSNGLGAPAQTSPKSRKRASIPKDAVTPRRNQQTGATAPAAVSAPVAPSPESTGDIDSAQGLAPLPQTDGPAHVDQTGRVAPADQHDGAAPVDRTEGLGPVDETASEGRIDGAAHVDRTDGPDLDHDTEGLTPVPGAYFAEVPIDSVMANRRQPRQVFDEEELEELAASIREVGVLQPIVVRSLPDGEDATYELIMGERRWRASQLAGATTVPAIVRQVEDNDLLRDALLENLHRAQLNPLEEAAAYQQLLEDFACTHEELASRIARSRPQISNTLRLLKLPPLVQRRVAAGILSAGHARALLGLSDPAAMERLAQRIVAEGLSVRTTEEIIALGDEPTAPELRRRPRTTAHTAELNELATRLSDRFDTRVKIGMGQRKGKINIEFASFDDLNRILEVLAPNVERPSLQ